MSAKVSTPSSLRAAAIFGPTPGSSVTALARSSLSGVLRAGPASSATGLEVGHAISPQAYVRTHDAAYLGDGPRLHTEPLREFAYRLGPRDVTEIQRPPGLGGGSHLIYNGVHLALAAPGALVRDDLAVHELENGPDVERGTHEALGATDPAAPGEVLERADREVQVAPPRRGLGRPPHVLELPTLVQRPQRLQQDKPRPHLRAPRVENLHGALDHPGGLAGGVVGAAYLARQRQHQDVVVVRERLADLDKGPGRRLGGGKELLGVSQALVELLVGHVHLVPVGLLRAEVEGERHHPHVGSLQNF